MHRSNLSGGKSGRFKGWKHFVDAVILPRRIPAIFYLCSQCYGALVWRKSKFPITWEIKNISIPCYYHTNVSWLAQKPREGTASKVTLIRSLVTEKNCSPCLVVMGDSSCSRGHGFEYRILDGYFLHWFVAKIVFFVWKRLKTNEKEAGDGPFLNNTDRPEIDVVNKL